MKKRHFMLAMLLICSMAFFVSYQALRTFAGPSGAYVSTSGSNHGTPVFSGEGTDNMAPGDTASSVLNVRNDEDFPVEVYKLAGQLTDLNTFADYEPFLRSLSLTITQDTILPSDPLYSGTMVDFINNGCKLSKGTIVLAARSETVLKYDVVFTNAAGNECQGKTCLVDFIVYFESDEDTGQGPGDGGNKDPISTADSDDAGPSGNEEPTQTTTVDLPSPTMVPGTPNVVTEAPAEPAAEPIMEILENPTSVLPETGWAGIAGGGLAAILMVGGGLALKGLSRRRWKS